MRTHRPAQCRRGTSRGLGPGFPDNLIQNKLVARPCERQAPLHHSGVPPLSLVPDFFLKPAFSWFTAKWDLEVVFGLTAARSVRSYKLSVGRGCNLIPITLTESAPLAAVRSPGVNFFLSRPAGIKDRHHDTAADRRKDGIARRAGAHSRSER